MLGSGSAKWSPLVRDNHPGCSTKRQLCTPPREHHLSEDPGRFHGRTGWTADEKRSWKPEVHTFPKNPGDLKTDSFEDQYTPALYRLKPFQSEFIIAI